MRLLLLFLLPCLQISLFAQADNNLDTIPIHAKTNWLNNFDFDGDHQIDSISFDYTGGAHCCYHISIKLSSTKKFYHYPFEMDGGYMFDVDNSWPDKFDIQDYDKDGLPEIKMKIQTYNGEIAKIPLKWKTTYHIKSNTILIEYEKEKLITRDF